MCCHERKVAEIVVKYAAIDRHNIRTASFVIRMADNTFPLLGCVKNAMKPGAINTVPTDLLVAIDTQCRLWKVRLLVMTGRTFSLNLGVTLDYPARHHQFLESGHLCGSGLNGEQKKHADKGHRFVTARVAGSFSDSANHIEYA